jgi:hypothetical protein
MKTDRSVIPSEYINFAYYAQGRQEIAKWFCVLNHYLELLFIIVGKHFISTTVAFTQCSFGS